MMRPGILILILIASALMLAAPAWADGFIIIDQPPDHPQVKLDRALAVKYHQVNVTIKDQVATTRVDQVFLNDNPWTAEGTYIFPLPEGASVSDFVMWVDGKPVRGELLKADEARAIYDDIVSRMRDPALLEYAGKDAVKASIFPIPPGEERKVELEYSQVLPADRGLVHYIYPLSTEKFSSRPLERMSLRAEIESKVPIKTVYSPSQEVYVDRSGDYRAVIGMEQSDVLPDKDFELYYTVSPEKIGLNLMSFKEPGQDGFFLLLAAPDVNISTDEAVARDVILVLDTSGSMEGEKLDQAKAAAMYILEHLHDQDRFDIVSFSTGIKVFRPEMAQASDIDPGIEFIRRLDALGGTDINRALMEAISMADPSRPATIIFLTDGQATEGVQDVPAILSNVASVSSKNIQIFAFGVGDDVDTDLLDGLSLDHRGTSSYVRPGQRIDEKVSEFYSKISTPVLSDIDIEFGGISVDQLYPDKVPDLFAGSQLILVGRYREGGPANISLLGSVNGNKVSFAYPDNIFSRDGGVQFIPRLWATRAIGYYLTQIRLHGENDEWVETVVSLSIRYGIVTPYTSYLIDEGDIFTRTGRQEIVDYARHEMAREAAEPSTGSGAVEKASYQMEMSAAPAPRDISSLDVSRPGGRVVKADQVIKYAGSKTFVLKNDLWIDTAYDSSSPTKKIEFLSQAYFDLISEEPDLGSYFALGSRVIAVYNGTAYEVTNPEAG